MPVLRASRNLYQFSLTDAMTYNLKAWLEYGLLEAGAYTTVRFDLPTSGYATLQKAANETYANRVYEGLGAGFVWEPAFGFQVSGVYVNGTWYPSTTSGDYAHKVDYVNGRVIFDSALSGTEVVKAEYVFRDVAVYTDDSPQWRVIVGAHSHLYSQIGSSSPSGIASVLKENRVWLPAIVIQPKDRSHTGLELGGGEVAHYAVFYHIFADRPFTAKSLTDLVVDQGEKHLYFFNINTAPPPFAYDGTISSGALAYPDLAVLNGPYWWTHAYLGASRGGPVSSVTDVFRGEARQTVEIERRSLGA